MYLQHLVVIVAALLAVVISLDIKGTIRKRETTGRCQNKTETGDCVCCKNKYRGSKCEISCETCITILTRELCIYTCEYGYYGFTCAHDCPDTCQDGIKGIPICKESENSFECSNGCKEGRYGRQCNNTCSSNCKDNVCYMVGGRCVDCKNNFFGPNCNLKCTSCIGGCFQNGTCKGGCRQGYQGPMCDKNCLTSCDECYETCSRQCQDECPKTVLDICLLNDTCRYNCYGNGEHHDICPNNEITPDEVEKAKAFPVIAIVLPVLLIIIVIGVLVLVCYRKKRNSRRQYNARRESRQAAYNDTGQEGTGAAESLCDDPEAQRAPRVNSFRRFQNYFWSIIRTQQEVIEVTDMAKISSQINPGVLIVTESPHGKKAITQMLDNWKHYSVKDGKGVFTVGEIASQKIVSIHLSRDGNGQLGPINSITLCLGSFRNVKHAIIVGVCSVSESKRENFKLGDVIASVSHEHQPHIYIQQSDKTWTPQDDSLQRIVKKLRSDGNTPWEKHNERSPDNLDVVANLHCGIFATTGEAAMDEDDETVTAFDSGVGEVLDSITRSGIKSFLLVRGVCDFGNETAEANFAAAAVARTVIERIDDSDS